MADEEQKDEATQAIPPVGDGDASPEAGSMPPSTEATEPEAGAGTAPDEPAGQASAGGAVDAAPPAAAPPAAEPPAAEAPAAEAPAKTEEPAGPIAASVAESIRAQIAPPTRPAAPSPFPASARRALKRSTDSGLWLVGRHIRGLCVKTCTQSPPIASIRSIALSIPPAVETWAPSCIASLR